tara:strand:- start:3746 stop:4150 length:405 start_codon:yes stop_codon:yes gene_type:complete
MEKFSENINFDDGDVEGSSFEIFGEIVEKKDRIVRTSKNVYGDEWYLKEDRQIKIRNEGWQKGEIRVVYTERDYGGRKMLSLLGYLLMKDNKPYIFSGINGDERGATVFNNTFIVTGHDGNYLYNVNDPFDFEF